MSQEGVQAAREHRAQQAAFRANLTLPERVHAAPETLKPLRLYPALNRATGEPGVRQLSEREDAVLRGGDLCKHAIGVRWRVVRLMGM